MSDKKSLGSGNTTFYKAITTIIIDVTMSLDNVLGVAGAAKQHLMATVANVISKWIKKYKWIYC